MFVLQWYIKEGIHYRNRHYSVHDLTPVCVTYLEEGYGMIIIIILQLNVLQGVPVSLAIQMIVQLLTIGELGFTEVTDNGAPTYKDIECSTMS